MPKSAQYVMPHATSEWLKSLRDDTCAIPGMEKIFDEPERIFNLDETGFVMDGTTKQVRVIAERGATRVKVDKVGDTSQLTVLFCGNAAGVLVPPMILVNGRQQGVPQPHSIDMAALPEASFWKTPSGWSCHESFMEWLKHFDGYLTSRAVQRPVLLVIDGHSSHISFPASLYAREHGIEINVIPPNSTSMIQPLDLSWMAPIKKYWKTAVMNFVRKYAAQNECVRKKNFPRVLKVAIDMCMHDGGQNLKSGFEKAGIYPYDELAPYRPGNEKLYKGDKAHQEIQQSLQKLQPGNFEVRRPKNPSLDALDLCIPNAIFENQDIRKVQVVASFNDPTKPKAVYKVNESTLQLLSKRRQESTVNFIFQ